MTPTHVVCFTHTTHAMDAGEVTNRSTVMHRPATEYATYASWEVRSNFKTVLHVESTCVFFYSEKSVGVGRTGMDMPTPL